MMTLNVNGKEYRIKFGYEPTLKSRLLSKITKVSIGASEGELEKVEDMLLFIPEFLLIGLQKEHSDEFGYNLDTNEGFEEQKAKAFSLVAEYMDECDADAVALFNELQEEMTKNGFLKKMFEREVEKEVQKTK